MSASNSNPGERDLEALRRAQRAHEPSMEEILASIRNIIADDREPARRRRAPRRRPVAPPPPPGRRSSIPRFAEPAPVLRAVAEPAAGAGRAEGRLAPARTRPCRRVRRTSRTPRAPAVGGSRRAVAASFGALSANVADAQRRDRRRHGARNAAPDAEGLARRKSASHRRAAGARRKSSAWRAGALKHRVASPRALTCRAAMGLNPSRRTARVARPSLRFPTGRHAAPPRAREPAAS